MNNRNKNITGYKETKVGWIPKDWEIKKLHNIAYINTESLGENTLPDYTFKYLDLSSVRDGVINFPSDTTTFLSAPCRARRVIKQGDILFATVRPNLKGFAYIKNVSTTLICSTGFAVLRTNNKSNNIFLYQTLYTNISMKYFYGCVVGSGYPALNNSDVKNIPVPLPPLPEQKKIADILSTWDEAIEQTRNLIDAKKLRQKGLMQQLLTGKKRLPSFSSPKKVISQRFFDIPVDWECPQIRDVATERIERNKEKEDIIVLACSKHYGFISSLEYFKKQIFSKDTSNYKIIRKNWFGFPANHIEEGSIGLLEKYIKGIVSPIYVVFSVCDRIFPNYLYTVFKTETFRHIFSISTNASVDRRGSLRWREFGLIRIPLPSLPEQKTIASVLHTASEEITNLENHLEALEKQKRGLMQKLLTGEVRVNV